MTRAIALVTALATASCSFLSVDAPPRRPKPGPVSCDIENEAVQADLGGFALLMLVSLLSTAAAGAGGMSRNGAIGLGSMSGAATLYGVSAYYGLHQLRRCHSLNGLPLPER